MLSYNSHTFPKTGAIPMITEAKAERTCWEESEDSSCRRYTHINYTKKSKKKLKVGPVMTKTSNGSNENHQNVHSKYLHTWNNVLNSKVRIQNSAEFCHFSSSCYPNFSLVITKKSHISRHQIRTSTT